MKALRVHAYGPGNAIVLDELPPPQPGPGQVRVRVQASGISFVDLLVARGGYQVKLPLPFVPGSEYAGVVDALGEGVNETLKVGDAVCGTRQGAWAQHICVSHSLVHPLPPHAPLAEGAVLLAPYATALYALRERGGLRPGETLLVLGAAGGVGHAAVQVGKALGARVIAIASGPRKQEAALAAGADEALNTADDWKSAVKALMGASGVDLAFDPVGGEATDTAFRTLGWCGRHLMVGFAGGGIGALKTNLSIVKGASLIGVDARQAGEREPETMHRVRADVMRLYAAGQVRPRIHGVLPLARFAEAAALAQERSTIGRVVVEL
jgi:NADPH2:quinone reductase